MAPTSTVVRVALYLRISRDDTGEGLAIDRQRAECQQIAETRGWLVVEEFTDSVTASDKRKDRPGYDRMVSAFDAQLFDALVCYDLDRLTRQPRQLEDWIDAAMGRGLSIVTANGEADLTTDGGRLFARMKATIARAEIERKAKRQQDAARQRAELGRPSLGVRPLGYTSQGEIIEEQAAIVRTIFEKFDGGESLRAIAAWLESQGKITQRDTQHAIRKAKREALNLEPTEKELAYRSRRWNPSSVRTILTNPRYASRVVYQGEVTGVKGVWPALVTDETFDSVQIRLSDPRRRTQVGTDRKHLGSSLYLCAECSTPVHAWSGTRYRCPEGCLTRSGRQVDAYVIEFIEERLSRADLQELLPVRQSGAATEAASEMSTLQLRLQQFNADYDAGDISGARHKIATEKTQVLLREAADRHTRATAQRDSESITYSSDPVAAFRSAPLMKQRAVLLDLVTIWLCPGMHGSRTFDGASVKYRWLDAASAS